MNISSSTETNFTARYKSRILFFPEMSLWTKLKQNHLLMMIVCCILPLALILLAIQYFGLSRNYAWWAVLLLCPLTHYFMMRNMHQGHDNSSTNPDNNSESQNGGDQNMEGKKKKGSCH